MNFKRFVSDPPQTPYAPIWDFGVGTFLCTDINTNLLYEFLLKNEKKVKKLPSSIAQNGKFSDGYTGLGKNSTTSKFQNYNILTWNHMEIKKLKQSIVNNLIKYNIQCDNNTPNNLWIQCWYNVLRFGQKIKPHSHSSSSNCYLSGHFNVQVKNTSTVYMSPINQLNDPDVINIKNKNAEMTLFPSYIFHYTTPHYSLKPRVTIAFDISTHQVHSNFIKL